MSLIEANLQGVNALINAAIEGREATKKLIFSPSVTLVAVSKTKPLANIMEAYAAGQRNFGENYVQEAVEKIVASRAVFNAPLTDAPLLLVNMPIQWHLVGPLQSNKAKLAALHFDWVHTVDRLKIAEALNTHRSANLKKLNVLIQVNISAETNKHGVAVEQLSALAAEIMKLPMLTCRGLMAIIEDSRDTTKLGEQFKQMWSLFSKLRTQTKTQYANFDTLSMGMSQDFQQAIDEGATMIRVGSAIFGSRDASNSSSSTSSPSN